VEKKVDLNDICGGDCWKGQKSTPDNNMYYNIQKFKIYWFLGA